MQIIAVNIEVTIPIESVIAKPFTGPVKGFAITLSIGIVTSMFTAIMCTRAMVNIVYGNKNISELKI